MWFNSLVRVTTGEALFGNSPFDGREPEYRNERFLKAVKETACQFCHVRILAEVGKQKWLCFNCGTTFFSQSGDHFFFHGTQRPGITKLRFLKSVDMAPETIPNVMMVRLRMACVWLKNLINTSPVSLIRLFFPVMSRPIALRFRQEGETHWLGREGLPRHHREPHFHGHFF
jgi:hypothetical protein